MPNHEWKPIIHLSPQDRNIDISDLRPLYESWRTAKERLRSHSPESLQKFIDRLIRSMSIETGILERLYDLDRGTTEALVMHGS